MIHLVALRARAVVMRGRRFIPLKRENVGVSGIESVGQFSGPWFALWVYREGAGQAFNLH